MHFTQRLLKQLHPAAALFFLALLIASPAPAASWAYSYGTSGNNYSEILATAVDAAGNVYVAGDFNGATLTLGSTTLTRIGSWDGFIAKLDSNGTVLWANSYGGAGAAASIKGIAVDNSGNSYLAGFFRNASLTTPALSKMGSSDAFALKLDASGNTLWAHNYGGNGASASGNAIAVDGSGNVYLGGDFSGSLTTPAVTGIGIWDAFALKLDASGNTLWARNYGGTGSYTYAKDIAADSSGNVYLGGDLGGNLTTPALTRIGTVDAFALKLDTSGNTLWAKNFGGAGASAYGYSIALDNSGNVYLGGSFSMASLTTPALSKTGAWDAFALKLDASGNTLWARNYGGTGSHTRTKGIALDGSGNVYLGGFFDSNLSTPALALIGGQDVFVFKLDASGNTLLTNNYGGAGSYTYANGFALDSSGNAYLGGTFESASLTTPALSLISSGGNAGDAYILKETATANPVVAASPGTSPIPALSEWGLLLMAGMLGMIGLIGMRRAETNR